MKLFSKVIWLINSLMIFSAHKNIELSNVAFTGQKWNLVFEEHFNKQEELQKNWIIYNGAGHNGNGMRLPEALSIDDGLLVIKAQTRDDVLISGGLRHRNNYKYGRFEFRVRTEIDAAEATSGVVQVSPQVSQQQNDTKTDIYITGTSVFRHPFHSFIHYGKDAGPYHYLHDANATEWRVMALEWTSHAILVYCDDRLVYQITDPKAIPRISQQLSIRLDAFKKTMDKPVRMYVDWVKIYQKTGLAN